MEETLNLVHVKWILAINVGHRETATNALAMVCYQSMHCLYRFMVVHQNVKRREESKRTYVHIDYEEKYNKLSIVHYY